MFDPEGMDRRGLIARALMLVGASVTPGTIDAFAASKARGRKRFLTAPQFALLSAIADTIIPVTDTPGAVAAGVPAKLDGMLTTWASVETRDKIVGALAAIDAAAKTSAAKGFAALAPVQRKSILVEYDKAALKPGPKPKVKLSALQALLGGAPVINPAYLKLKELVIALYYSSEIASTKELIYEHNPGTWVPSLKITPESRPFAGTGGLF
jgi:gluconate 2-dehydrogenase gamma chain